MNKMSLKLVYFEGCPNAKLAETRLTEAGIEFEKICQDSLAQDSPYKKYSSPTLFMGEAIVFGAATGTDDGCSLALPDVPSLQMRLQKMSQQR